MCCCGQCTVCSNVVYVLLWLLCPLVQCTMWYCGQCVFKSSVLCAIVVGVSSSPVYILWYDKHTVSRSFLLSNCLDHLIFLHLTKLALAADWKEQLLLTDFISPSAPGTGNLIWSLWCMDMNHIWHAVFIHVVICQSVLNTRDIPMQSQVKLSFFAISQALWNGIVSLCKWWPRCKRLLLVFTVTCQ